MNFDLKRCVEQDDGKCVTRDGLEARVICVDRKCNGNPVVALVDNGRDEHPYAFSKTGFCAGMSGRDLRNLPHKRYTVMVSSFGDVINETFTCDTRKEALEISEGRTDVVGIYVWKQP